MSRLPRILLNAATIVALVLFVATLALWGVSYRWACAWVPIDPRPSAGDFYAPALVLASAQGRLLCKWDFVVSNGRRYDVARVGSWRFADGGLWEYAPDAAPTRWRFAGFAFGRGEGVWAVMLPHACLAVVTGLLPLARGSRWYARRASLRSGHCRTCGYDLRATPDRCPECGTIPHQ